ncbi:uncharacterized protein AB675_1355 [Cyphellophora attinorum]|uniref:Uncharacterized protein n=1 Tax=Cyphellophora attinorum TaxID=1664694 RepID=A0A0N0NI78_9EURO|nr:uncharacterized protein AB675_1355 [Phialophora attinorum]KPI35119.1 hypothetical protein AB675_1355 [Phialophora attinorum]
MSAENTSTKNLDLEVARHQKEFATIKSNMSFLQAYDNFMSSRSPEFFTVFKIRMSDLTRRDPDPRKQQLTLNDHLMLNHTKQGTDFHSHGAIYYYLLTYYKIDLNQPNPNFSLVDEEIAAFFPNHDIKPEDRDMDDEISSARFDFPSSSTNINEDRPVNPQPQRQRLLDAYEEACNEYIAVANARNGSTLQAAKYLRDTAENLVMFIDDLEVDPKKREDILLMFETAKLAVQELTGGKIRKFDTGYRSYQRHNSGGAERKPARPNYRTRARLAEGYDVRNNGRRSVSPVQDRPYYHSPRGQSSTPGPRHPSQYSTSERYYPRDEPARQYYEPRDDPIRQFQEPVRRDSVRDTQDHLDSQRGSCRLPSERPAAAYPYSMGAYEVRAPEYRLGDEYRVRDHQQSGTYRVEGNTINTSTGYTGNDLRGRNKGRGHSGIPYGYNQDRQVDSYKPGQS